MKAGETIALEQDDPMSRSRKPRRRHRAGWTAAGDDHVAVVGHGDVLPELWDRSSLLLRSFLCAAAGEDIRRRVIAFFARILEHVVLRIARERHLHRPRF